MDTKITPKDTFSAIKRSNRLSESTKAKYRRELEKYLATGHDLDDIEFLQEYAAGLSTSGRSFLKAAIRKITEGTVLNLKASATPDNLGVVQAALLRFDALGSAIEVRTTAGTKSHAWLSKGLVKKLMSTCGDDLEGRRDWIVLALLVGAGLRREELAALTFDALKMQGNRWVLDVRGKGDKNRVVPISATLANRLQAWRASVGDGLVARSIGRKRELGESLSTVAIFHIVRKHGAAIGNGDARPELAPHDLRRTYAQLGYEAGIPITQISKLLGHSSVETTQKYLNLDLDLDTTISDFIPLE